MGLREFQSGRLVGRLDPKLHRDRGLLEVKGLWWEPGIKAKKARKRHPSGKDEAAAEEAPAKPAAKPRKAAKTAKKAAKKAS